MIEELTGRNFSVIGIAKSGVAAANVLIQRGCDVLISDKKSESELTSALALLDQRVNVVFGKNVVREGDTVVLSPGVKPHSATYIEAHELGAEVWGEVELFYRLCPAPIIAISGTDGKSTTTELIAQLLRASYDDVHVGGNIGNPLCGELDKLTRKSLMVAEISCFQLMTIDRFRPAVAVFTNIAEDHTSYHGSHAAYQAAKRRLYENMGDGDFVVLNLGDQAIAGWKIDRPVQLVPYDRNQMHSGGLTFKSGKYYSDFGGRGASVVATQSDVPLPGVHNIENTLAALAVARIYGIDIDATRAALRRFRGLPHRLETIGTVDDVTYINDSKATNPHAAIAALKAMKQPVILLAGGAEKKSDYSEFADHIEQHSKMVVLYGETRERLRQAIGDRVQTYVASSLDEAVQAAHNYAQPGDTVLLAPASSSFDMFRSFEHRGEVFVELVRALGHLIP